MLPIKPIFSAQDIFLNNFRSAVVGPFEKGSTYLMLEKELPSDLFTLDKSDIQIPFGVQWGVPLTLSHPAVDGIEIVYVTSGGGTYAAQRAREGTEELEWPVGTIAECRLTAQSLAMLTGNADASILIGRFARATSRAQISKTCIVIGHDAEMIPFSPDWQTQPPNHVFNGITIGSGAKNAASMDSVVIGSMAAVGQKHPSEDAPNPDTPFNVIAIGSRSAIGGSSSGAIAIGGVVGGYDAQKKEYISGAQSIAMGENAAALAREAIAVGAGSAATASSAVAVGTQAAATAEGAIALGLRASNQVEGSLVVSAVSLLADKGHGRVGRAASRAAMQSVISTDVLELSSAGRHAAFELPPHTIMLVDSFDLVITESMGVNEGQIPEIKIGYNPEESDVLLAATEVTETDLYARTTFTPAHSHGVTSVRIEVVKAASGTLKGKLIVRGYVMEV